MKRDMTCIICPMGCHLTVTREEDGSFVVVGNTCTRGKSYAIAECTHPVRTLTTTAPTEDGRVIPVKTSRPIPRELLFDAMRVINSTVVPLPAHIGDKILCSLLETDADVVVTANME